MSIDVRCPACGKGARVNCPRPVDERRAAASLKRDVAERCPRNRGSNALPCPMAVNHESEAEKAI